MNDSNTRKLARTIVHKTIKLVTRAMRSVADPHGSAEDASRAIVHEESASLPALPPELAKQVHAVTWPHIHEALHALHTSMQQPKQKQIVKAAYDLLCEAHECSKDGQSNSDPFTLPSKHLVKARKLHGRMRFRGLDISIENRKGSYRHWYDVSAQEKGRTKMRYSYGYVRRTEGTDGDHVDVYVGPNVNASTVYVITQMRGPDFTEVDEQKCMLGFASADKAKRAYLAHYNDPRFFGRLDAVPFETFKEYVLDPKNHGELIKSRVRPMRFVKSFHAPIFSPSLFAAQGGAPVKRQPVPDMRTWEQPKSDERKLRSRRAEEIRRRAFAKWARGALSLFGEPPERRLRYGHQYIRPYVERNVAIANRTPQIITDPLTGQQR